MPKRPSQMDNLSSGVGNMGLGGSGSGRPRLPNIIDKHIATAEAESSTSRVQPQQQEGAWSTVKNGRRSTVSFADPPAQQTRRVPSSTTRPRRSAYSPPKKAYLKQSCLPTEDQDKDLLEVEELKSHKLAREDFKPGMIIRALVHEQDYQASSSRSNITVADKYRSDTKYGPIYTKARKMIVLSLFEDHYTAIPVFTHNGNGLDRKNRPEEFVSIKDHRAKYEVPPLSLNGQLVTDTMFPGAKVFDVKSTAHVTYALSRRYDMPCVKEGHLTKKSSNHLIKLFNAYAPRFLTDERGRVIQ